MEIFYLYNSIMVENSIILSSLIKNQRGHISLDKKLSFKDLNRISYNLTTNIFTDECSIWNGYITNINSKKKNCYISFFFKNKKVSLHRLLFANYAEDINDNEYIKYICNNKGKCCTINHMKKTLKEYDTLNKEDDTVNKKDDTVNKKDDTVNKKDDTVNKKDDTVNKKDDTVNKKDDTVNNKTNDISKNRVYF
jgi:hypothetical protein